MKPPTRKRKSPSVPFEGDVESFWGYGTLLWSVARVEHDSKGEETSLEVVAHGEARSMHGAKSIIAKVCRQHARSLSRRKAAR